MTSSGPGRLGSDRIDVRPGLVGAIVVMALYGGFAASVDFARAARGFYSDEATYYLMGHSVASDGDLAYRREDLARVWREFPSGPLGVFLKRGRDVEARMAAGWPPLAVESRPDPDQTRLYYGKSFVYPLLAAPFVRMMGTNGFLMFNAVLLALVTLAAYVFVAARARPAVALTLSTGFVFASVVPLYYVWVMPEVFNFAAVGLAYFGWFLREVAERDRLPRGMRWVHGSAGDVVAAILLGMATFSKPSNVLLVAPPLIWLLWRRGLWRTLVVAIVFAAAVAALFGANVALSGEWNYQGGERATCYTGFPFLHPGSGLEVCLGSATDRVYTELIFDPEAFWTVLWHNLGYVFIGRYSGLVAYFFPAVFALLVIGLRWRRVTAWESLALLGGLGQLLLFVLWTPNTYSGGGGSVGNRYFISGYGAFLVLLPALQSALVASVPWIVGGVFTAQLTLNAFYSSFSPAEHAKQGPLRWLPVELSLVNDLPVNTNPSRVRVLFGEEPRFQIYFLDDNAYNKEDDGFWTRGDSTAEMLVKSAGPARELRVKVAAGPVRTTVHIEAAGQRQAVTLAGGEVREVALALPKGFPYRGTRVWRASIRTRGGFVPMFVDEGTDHRYLGVRVTPTLVR